MSCCEGRQCLWQALVAAVWCREVGLVGLFMGHAWRLVCGGFRTGAPGFARRLACSGGGCCPAHWSASSLGWARPMPCLFGLVGHGSLA